MKPVLWLLVLPACAHAMVDEPPAEEAGTHDASAPSTDASHPIDASVDVAVVDDDGGTTMMETGAPDVVETGANDAGVTGRVVFVSSALYDGNLGGLTGADTKCQGLATVAGLPGTYKAWLSDTTTSAAQRLSHATTPYVLVDSTVVANDWSGLTSGTLLHAIDLTESGQAPSSGTYKCTSDPSVWSHTSTSGATATNTGSCSDWSSTSATTTHAGSSLYKSYAWTDVCQLGGAGVCAKTASLYCIQQ